MRNKAHEAIIHRRYGPGNSHCYQFMQTINGKDTVRIGICVVRVVVGMIYSNITGACIAGNLTKASISMRVEQVMGWLLFQVHPCRRNERDGRLCERFKHRSPRNRCIGREMSIVMHFTGEFEPAPEAFFQVGCRHSPLPSRVGLNTLKSMPVSVSARQFLIHPVSLLSHLFMHGPTLRPLLAPVIPTLNAIRHPLKVIDIHAVGAKARSPVVDRALYRLVSLHVFTPSRS